MGRREVELLQELVTQQQQDDKSRRVSKSGHEITIPPAELVVIADSLMLKHGRKFSISWGMPAKIAQCKDDKHCPQCGCSRQSGFDIGISRGLIFGCRCECGFAF